MTSIQCSYRKTKSGQWAVMGPVNVIKTGATVTVTKKSGETKTETIASVGKPFSRAGVEMVYGYPSERNSHSSHRSHRSQRNYGCPECGSDKFNGIDMCLNCMYSPM